MLKNLPIKLKLILLAGVPVIGALLLSYLVAIDAQKKLESAKALGSVEDLARLAQTISQTTEVLQAERSGAAFAMGTGAEMAAAMGELQANSNARAKDLDTFLKERDLSRLPKRLSEGLGNAQKKLQELPNIRAVYMKDEAPVETALDPFSSINSDLVNATAALTGLSDDGEMLRNISALVSVMELQERASQERALLSYVFAKSEYPPGAYKEIVNLVTEQEVFAQVLSQSTSEDLVKLYQEGLKDKSIERAQEIRQIALDTVDDDFGIKAEEWANVQGKKVDVLSALSAKLNERVKNAALAKLNEATTAVNRSFSLSGAVLLISVALAFIIARGISRSVRSLSGASNTVQTQKDFSVRAQKHGSDELGRLTDAFNEMLDGIQARDQELEDHRQNLESLVQARTAELAKRNEAMRMVLDNVEQGLATINVDGSLENERSAIFDRWFPDTTTAATFSKALAANDNNMEAMLQLSWETVTDGFLPMELAIDQMPNKLIVQDRHYELTYKPMGDEESFGGALLMVSDVTAEVERMRREIEQREFISVFQAVMKDKSGFIEFFNETENLVNQIVDDTIADDAVLKRVIHTVKGNTAIYGITSVADACHELESACVEDDRRPNHNELQLLRDVWTAFATRVRSFASTDEDEVIEVQYDELENLIRSVNGRKPYPELATQLEALKDEPTATRFKRIGEQAKSLALKLGKSEITVNIESNNVRLPSDRWANFWGSFIHCVRNSLDHGIENQEERLAAGKPESGTINLRSRIDNGDYIIEMIDDGRGIDWQRVAEKAKSSGLPHSSREDLVEALFSDGLSTRDQASDMSGRGVGMSAVRDACLQMKGEISINSIANKGTTIRFKIPTTGNSKANPMSRAPGARPSLRPPPRRVGAAVGNAE